MRALHHNEKCHCVCRLPSQSSEMEDDCIAIITQHTLGLNSSVRARLASLSELAGATSASVDIEKAR